MNDESLLTRLGCVVAVLILGTPVAAQPWPPSVDTMIDVDRSRIGVQVQPMTAELREHFEAPADRGLLVSRVDRERPAAEAGMEVGDILLEAAGEPLSRPYDLLRLVSRVPEGEELEITALRDGKPVTFTVKPQGQGVPWLNPDFWREWAEEGLQLGNEEIRRHLRELDRRLEELQRKLEELQKESNEESGQRT